MRRNGFTLLEVLVALAILGFLLVGLSQGVRFGVRAYGMQAQRVASQADMDATLRAVHRLIGAADPGDANDPSPLHGTAHTLSFASTLPEAVAAETGGGADIAIGVDDRQRLVLRASLRMHAERLSPAGPPLQTVLLEGVDRVDFAYYQATGRQPGWRGTWSADALPALVRMHIAFAKHDKRHWPDLIALTRMTRDED